MDREEAKKLAASLFKVAHYGEERELNASENEKRIYEILIEKIPEDIREKCRFVRVSDQYVTIKAGDWDFFRFKFTPRVQWIMCPIAEAGQKKHRFDDRDDFEEMVHELDDLIEESIETYRRFN